jgi:hypothetical protein
MATSGRARLSNPFQGDKTMSDEIVRKILAEMEHDSAREDSLRRMIAGAFEARTRVFTLIGAVVKVAALAAAVWMAVLFFQTDEIRSLILYATAFNTCMLILATTRLFLWQLLLRQGVMREIKRLELRLFEFAKITGSASTTANERQDGPHPWASTVGST